MIITHEPYLKVKQQQDPTFDRKYLIGFDIILPDRFYTQEIEGLHFLEGRIEEDELREHLFTQRHSSQKFHITINPETKEERLSFIEKSLTSEEETRGSGFNPIQQFPSFLRLDGKDYEKVSIVYKHFEEEALNKRIEAFLNRDSVDYIHSYSVTGSKETFRNVKRLVKQYNT